MPAKKKATAPAKPGQLVIDAKYVYYRDLNAQIREAAKNGIKEFVLDNIQGQRYIADALDGDYRFTVNGVPGQDMAAFMRGPHIKVEGNAQDGVGNTMDDGKIVINGMAGDVVGYAMRGGRIYIRKDVGYRVGIHMKAFQEKVPVIVIGGKAGDFLGEYMAGGAIILLGLFTQKEHAPIAGRSLGTGMHAGAIFVQGDVPREQLDFNIKVVEPDDNDKAFLAATLKDYCEELDLNYEMVTAKPFIKLVPISHRPYGNMYVG